MIYKSPFPEPPRYPERNIQHLLHGRPEQSNWPDYTLYIDADTARKTTYRQFLDRVSTGRTALGAPVSEGGLGLKAVDGEMVGIMSINSAEYAVLIHALLGIAVPFTLISSYSTKFELAHAIRLSKLTCLFVHTRFLPTVLAVSKGAGLPYSRIYVIGGSSKGRKSFADLLEAARRRKISPVNIRPVTSKTLAYLVFSSGTTGLPKAVMISHGNLIFSVLQAAVIGQTTTEVYAPPPPPTPEGLPVVLAFLPFYHTYGLHAFVFRSFLSPATFIILSKWKVETALKVIPKYSITELTLIPSVIHQLVTHPTTSKADLRTVRSVASGAAYLPPELSEQFTSLLPNKELRRSDGYGMSEMTVAGLVLPFPGILGGRFGSLPRGCAGILLPGMEARIVREDGTDADVDEVGQLYIRGKNVALGYWDNEKANKETFVDGWLITGDQFRVNKDEYFFFTDRAKDTLKVSGAQVSPVEIENLLLAHPSKIISDATVAGVSGGRTSDEKVPRAWVVLSPTGKKLGASEAIKELERWHQENLSKFKWLRGGIEIVREIPKSPTGKTLKRVLQDRYEDQMKKRSKAKL